MQPYPHQDNDRAARVVGDICDLLHDTTAKTQARALRWITHVLNVAALYRRWWFLENAASATVGLGQDVVDLRGHLDRVAAVYAGKRLTLIPLQTAVELRHAALADSLPNAGPPTHYALESGRRVHLWPCPDKTYPFAVLYSRPIAIELVPDSWETIVLDGVLGLYGRHFDRDALTQDPAEFERRFRAGLRQASPGHHDVSVFERFKRQYRGRTLVTANSSTDTAIEQVEPASLTGIGYVSIELGDYPLQVA